MLTEVCGALGVQNICAIIIIISFLSRLKVTNMIRNYWLVLADGRLGGWSKMAPKEVTTTIATHPSISLQPQQIPLIQMTFNT